MPEGLSEATAMVAPRGVDFEMGLGGRPARLTGECRMLSLEQLMAGGGRG